VHSPEPVKVTLVVNDRRPLNLTLSLAYTPALFDARDRHTRRRYSLTPFSDYPVTLSSADIDEDRLPRFFAERARARLAREGGGTFHIPMLTRWIMRDLS
jgi:hypothetical protein